MTWLADVTPEAVINGIPVVIVGGFIVGVLGAAVRAFRLSGS